MMNRVGVVRARPNKRYRGTARLSVLLAVSAVLFSACSTAPAPGVRIEPPAQVGKPPASTPSTRPGGYYQDDGPGKNPPPNLGAIPDAEPRPEPLNKFANRPYTVLGHSYTPDVSGEPYKAQGIASWYGRKFHNQRTSSGEIYDMYAMSAAHPTLPIPSYARVTNVKTGKSVIVRINDRGPFHSGRIIDLSYAAAYKLGIAQAGSGEVEVESIDAAHEAPATASIAAKEEKPEEPVRVASDEGYWLQLGAFNIQANAEQLLTKLKTQLGSLADLLRIQAVDGLYRLRAGPFNSTEEANDAAVQLKRVADIQPVLLR